MGRKKMREIDIAFKPIVRDRKISAVSMIAYLGTLFCILFCAQYTAIRIFNNLFPLYGNVDSAILPMALISALVILFWGLRIVRFPIVLVAFAIYLLYLYFKITGNPEDGNNIRTFIDVIINSLSEYYGFHWGGFGAGSNAEYLLYMGRENTVLNALLLFYLPFTTLLGYNMIRKFRFSSISLAILFPCFFALMNGYMPDRVSFLLLIFLFSILSVLGIQMKIEEKQQVVKSKKNGRSVNPIFCLRPPKAAFPLFGVGLATLAAAMTFPTLVEERLTEAIKPAQEFMYSGGPEKLLKALRGKIFGSSSGGISGGDLPSTGNIKPDKDHVLLTVHRSYLSYYRYAYLKCYVGEAYTGKRWTDLPDVIRRQYAANIPGGVSRRGYYRLSQVLDVLDATQAYNPGDKRLKDTLNIIPSYLYITNVDYEDGYRVMPYLSNLPDTENLALYPYKKEEMQAGDVVSYDFMYCNVANLVRLYDAYCHEKGLLPGVTASPQDLADAFYEKIYRLSAFEKVYSMDNGKSLADYLFQYNGDSYDNAADRDYAQMLNEYLVVPDSVKQLREYMKGVQLDGVEDAVIYVRETLSRLADYTQTPGKIPNDRDFVDSFLFEKKVGYCMHFATAGTIMFRLLGIPARYVEGFYLPPGATADQMLTEENAHAWAEIYLKNLGWVPIEVTPGFGDRDSWRKWENDKPKPTQPETTQAVTKPDTSLPAATTSVPESTQIGDTIPVVVPGHSLPPGSLTQTDPGTNEKGSSVFPIVLAILKVIGILLVIVFGVYLLIFFRRSLIVTKRYRGFTQKDVKKSISALYADMRKLAAIEHCVFTYESDASQVVGWFDELSEEEPLFAEAIDKINLCFFGNRELTEEERKTVRMARNKLAKAVAKRQTGRKKARFRLWYGY